MRINKTPGKEVEVNLDRFDKHLNQILVKANSFLASNSMFYFPDNGDFYQYLRIKFWQLCRKDKYDFFRTDAELTSFQWKWIKLRAVDYLRSITRKTDAHNFNAVSYESLLEDLDE
jgi:hypothetical protein